MSMRDLENILESINDIKETIECLIKQEEYPESISINGQLNIIRDKVSQAVEAHFNKDKYYTYKVYGITMTSSFDRTSFVVKIASKAGDRVIQCNLSMDNSSGNLQIENIYHEDGSPVEGFTK